MPKGVRDIKIDWENPEQLQVLFNDLRSAYADHTQKKIFEVEWNNPDSVRRTIQSFKARHDILIKKNHSRRERNRILLESCQNIFKTDISSVYSSMKLDTEQKFYVYAHLDTMKRIAIGRDGITTFAATLGMEYFPFYVGKGTGGRSDDINRNETHRKVRMKLEGINKEPLVVKIQTHLSEIDALMLESKLIDIFGLIPHGGILTNLDEGVNKDERRALYRSDFNQLRRLNGIL